MVFWGVEVKPQTPYTHRFNASKDTLRVSMASLGAGNTIERSQLIIKVGNKEPLLVCSLIPNVIESVQLHFQLKQVNEEVVFSVDGNRSIHIFGHFIGRSSHCCALKHKSESSGEDIGDVDSPRSDYGEDKYESTFIDDSDDTETFTPSRFLSDGGLDFGALKEPFYWKRLHSGKRNRKRKLKKASQISKSEEEGCSHTK